jgi:hypothetical protein
MVNATPQPLYPRERDPVPILQEVGCAPESVWQDAEISQLKGFDPWTVQSIASRYIDYTIFLQGWTLCEFQNEMQILSLYNYKLV